MTVIRAVTFDVGGTLIDPWPSVGAVYAEVARKFAIDCHPDILTSRFLGAWRTRSDFGYTRAEWFDIVRQSFAGDCNVSPALFEAIYHRFTEREAWLIYDDVIPTLLQLEALGLKLAIISNWDERLVPLLATLGLSTYFGDVIVSSAVGAHKPDPRIFHHAAQILSCEPAEILHVGDSLREDIEGARAAGFQAVQLRRSGSHPPEIGQLTAVLTLLQTTFNDSVPAPMPDS